MLWNNKNRLVNMKVNLKEKSRLFVYTKDEEVVVELDNDNDIERVIVNKDKKSFILEKKDRVYISVGEGNYLRDVYHYLTMGGPTKELRLGITKHKGLGTWSSLPHDFELNVEQDFEEVFFYLLQGGTKRALQVGVGMWPDGTKVEDVWFVHDKTFSSIPMGYHPIVGEVGVKVSYVWMYLAKKKEWEKLKI